MFALPRLIYNNKLSLPSLPPPGTFAGQTILITGATGGLGLHTAIHFVNLGASTVYITARTPDKGLAAKASIVAQTSPATEDVIKVLELNMSTLAGVKTFAERAISEVKSVDYVLLNAGCLNKDFKMGEEGVEETIQVNVLSTALLAVLLIDWLKVAGKGKAHLGFVTSGLHRGVKIDPSSSWPQTQIVPHFSDPSNWPKGGMYATSKLLEQYITLEIAKLALGEDGVPQVKVVSMCPGMVKSDLGRSYKTSFIMAAAVDIFMTVVSKSTESGARTLVLADLVEENGGYVTHYQSDEEYKKATEHNIWSAEGQKMQATVWKEVCGILEEKYPEVGKIVGVKSA